MKYRTRNEWGARKPKRVNGANMDAKSTGHWNGPTVKVGGKTTWSHDKCDSLVRGIQNFHMDGRGWNDIAYNFVVCPHETVYEGRGLNVINGANGTNVGNRTSHAVMWLSGQENPFTEGEKNGFRLAVRFVSERTAAPDVAIGHRDHKSTECPGNERYNWIKGGMRLGGAGLPTEPGSGLAGPTLTVGSRGEFVELLQVIIRDKAGGGVPVDGYYGPTTAERVMDLQKFFGLEPDGIVGPKTWSIVAFLHGLPMPKRDSALPLKIGDRGPAVGIVQTIIRDKAGGDIPVDEYYGPKTASRVKNLQKFFGLEETGMVDEVTWDVLVLLNS